MDIPIGEVISVKGVKIILNIFEESSKEVLFYKGEKYKGISIREFIIIQRGFVDIVCAVEGEFLDESSFIEKNSEKKYIRKIEVKPIGYFKNGKFNEGIKFLPMIKDAVFLITEDKITKIYSKRVDNNFIIGEMLKEGLPVSLPWQKLFNSHIGIFGNTGSGKSNTLAKLFTLLFDKKKHAIRGNSFFTILDFNGEYTRDQLISAIDKKVYNLNTSSENSDKFPLHGDFFWNTEILSILFKATEGTQKPFISRLVRGREKFNDNPDSLLNYLKSSFKRAFTTTSPKRESLELLKQISIFIDAAELTHELNQLQWFGGGQNPTFKYGNTNTYFNGNEEPYDRIFRDLVNALTLNNIDPFDELFIRINLQLINDLLSEYVQFDFIQPLLKRVEDSTASLKRVISFIQGNHQQKLLTVVSLRKCNQDIKKILPLLIAKQTYELHKKDVSTPPNKTVHLIIDEAHNILSQQSVREQTSWKDYRLELFEEIIKEGRKFGMYLTIASQRPADISPTVMSQLHNFFLHRLVNDKDLLLIDNSLSTLDRLSKEMIPSLPTGSCIVTGTSFNIPLVIQVEQLSNANRPDSEDVNLDELWEG
ncbi:ATP-binding protein [Pseudobdellovibrio sp. HCB154]|uniref:ATP-binding protein n=1 Tax=Pseudobdellovibrio sp. HCB154 TaxID=3386277 RepID=UPI003917530F